MAISDFTTFANREVVDGVFYDFNTQEPFLNCDFANVTTTEITGETVFAYGGQGHPKRVPFSGERGGSITIETQIQTPKLYSLITGADLTSSAVIPHREVIKCATANTLNVRANPTIGTIYVYESSDDCGEALEGTYTAAAATSPATGYDVSFTAGSGSSDTIAVGTTYVIYYFETKTSGVKAFPIKSTTFPKAFKFSGITQIKTEADEILEYVVTAYKCMPQSNFSVSFSNTGDPSTITITCDLLADTDDNLLDLVMVE